MKWGKPPDAAPPKEETVLVGNEIVNTTWGGEYPPSDAARYSSNPSDSGHVYKDGVLQSSDAAPVAQRRLVGNILGLTDEYGVNWSDLEREEIAVRLTVLLQLAHPEDAPAIYWTSDGEPHAYGPDRRKCTGVSAAWCPIHGDCICVRDGVADLDDPNCPLHNSASTHAEVEDAPESPVPPEGPWWIHTAEDGWTLQNDDCDPPKVWYFPATSDSGNSDNSFTVEIVELFRDALNREVRDTKGDEKC
jgi:nitrite reductase/ring-hydroxylating ferredoxin subunit